MRGAEEIKRLKNGERLVKSLSGKRFSKEGNSVCPEKASRGGRLLLEWEG